MKKNIFHKLTLFIRSLIFSIFLIVGIIFYSVICLIAFIFPLRIRYLIIKSWTLAVIWVLKVVCRITYTLEGLENIPTDRNGILMSKHQSAWETFFLPGFFNEIAIIVKRELLWIPFFGWGLASIEPIAINRSNKARAMDQIITKGKECLDNGRWILVFPEGTRIPVGHVGHYRLGGARLAVATEYPIIPVAHNAGHFWPRRKFIKNPGNVHVVFGPLIETKNRAADEVLAEVKNWIETTMKRIEGGCSS